MKIQALNRRVYLVLLWLAALAALFLPDANSANNRQVLLANVEGTINPAIDDYIAEAIATAQTQHVAALVIRLDTPGGLLDSTRTIVQALLAANVPIIIWVGPAGARAASAGMFITMAAHIAAMAPGTNIGAATPINSDGKDVKEEGGEHLGRKVMEDTRAFARSIAEVRGRPAGWMEAAVSDAVSITADEALRQGVIDLTATDIADLLNKADGRSVKLAQGSVTLATAGASISELEMRPGQLFMHYLSHPNIAYLLMLLGMLGIYFELSAPGGYIAGVLGAISLLLAFISFQVLPFHTGGLLLILLAIVLFVAEAFVPSMGILAAGGFASFIFGSLILFRTPELDVTLDLGLIAGATVAFGIAALAIGFLVLKAQRRPAASGVESLLGQTCEALTNLDPNGKVFLQGEIWNAHIETSSAHKGERLIVTAVDGLHLTVRKQHNTTTQTST